MTLQQAVELGSVLVLALFFSFSERARPWEALAVSLGAFLGEEACIRWYSAYQYSPGWTVFVDRLPLAVLFIWPAVVLSARAVLRALLGRAPALLVGLLVVFDAALVEPVATHAGLWSWNLPGFFSVPPIGPLGWGCYAAAASFLLDKLSGPRALAAALGAPVLAHAGILALWWGGLRWLQADISALSAALASLLICIAAAAAVLASRKRLPWREAIPRGAAAGLFAGLLWAAPDRALLLYAAPFALPWLLLLRLRPGPAPR